MDFVQESLPQIISALARQRAPSRTHVPDSRFSTAAVLVMEDVATGQVYTKSAANMEPSVANGSNICAERLALGAIVSEAKLNRGREGNSKLRLLAVFVQGASNSYQAKGRQGPPNYCMCCYKCVDALMPYLSDEKEKPSQVFLVPTIRNKSDDIQFALENLRSYDLSALAAPILRLDVEDAFDWDSKRLSGICKGQNITEKYAEALRPLKEKCGIDESLPPITGKIDKWLKAALQMEYAETKWVPLILAAARNQLYETNQGYDVRHIEVAIAQATNGSFFINASIGGNGMSRTDSAIYRVNDGPFAVNRDLSYKKIWLMGDGYADKKRLYPTITDLHILTKRAASHVEEGKKISDQELLIYPPTHGFSEKALSIDDRCLAARISKEPERYVIGRVSLSELCMGASGFVSAKEQAKLR